MTAPKTEIFNIAEGTKMKPVRGTAHKWLSKNWGAVFAEYVATCLLLLFGCMSCIPLTGFDLHPPMYTPIGFGLTVLFLVSTFGPISGAHINPTVTTAAMIVGQMSPGLGMAYFLAQCCGAITGYGLLVLLSPVDVMAPGLCVTLPYAGHHPVYSIVIEVLLTMSLALLCCSMWDPANAAFSDSASIKFGFSIAGFSIVAGPLTGASINPARSLAPAIFTGVWAGHYIYWVGPFAGSILGAYMYKFAWLKKEDTTVT